MDLENLKLTGNNIINLTDSLEAPILRLKIKANEGNSIPNTNDLIINVKKTLEAESEEKVYVFTLDKPLQVNDVTSDEFILEPIVKGNQSMMKGYVIRNISEGELLDSPVIEDINVEDIILYEGENHITTNYENCIIEIMYPKDCELIKTLLGINNLDKKFDVSSFEDLYFKDCFTKTDEGKINANFNKATLKCFNSENQTFSMDCEGNLVVNSITTRENIGKDPATSNLNFDKIYPIGSIYLSVSNTNPSTLFGGQWEQIQDMFLLGAGTTYGAGTTGGSATNSHSHSFSHTHSVPGISHSHNLGDNGYAKLNLASTGPIIYAKMNTGVSFAENYYMKANGSRTAVSNDTTKGVILLGGNTESTTPGSSTTNSQSTATTGGASNTNNMPPYLAVYIWKRIA